MILECERPNDKVTADKDLQNLVVNQNLKNEILKSDIETIYLLVHLVKIMKNYF